jgi:MFS family permease
MVVAAGFITALIIAGTLSHLFAKTLKRRGKRKGFFWFFLIIFMITWAGGVWLTPFGPALLGIHWLPFILVGLVGAIVISFVAQRRYPRGRHETIDLLESIEEGRELEQMTFLSLNILFWIVLFMLLAAVLLRYILG